MSAGVQTYANHRRTWPIFHYVLFPIILINIVVAVRAAMTERSWTAHWLLLVSIALLLLAFTARISALTVQNRVIRLEMRLRCQLLLPSELFARFDDLRVEQLVALRFAGDGELAELVRRSLAGEFAKADDIKRAITAWKADHLRV